MGLKNSEAEPHCGSCIHSIASLLETMEPSLRSKIMCRNNHAVGSHQNGSSCEIQRAHTHRLHAKMSLQNIIRFVDNKIRDAPIDFRYITVPATGIIRREDTEMLRVIRRNGHAT